MSWRMFRIGYELLSPLHVGYHKVGNVQRTRYYVPARNLWAAVTVRLTRSGLDPTRTSSGSAPPDYQEMGKWVGENCRFSYLFLRDSEERLLYPCFGDKGLCYGSTEVGREELERQFLSSHVTTALDSATGTAAEASLHEVEFISPRDEKGERTCLCGWVWFSERGVERLGGIEECRKLLGELQVGGERRYGFGRMGLTELSEVKEVMEGYEVALGELHPKIKLEGKKPVLAHVGTSGVDASGEIEPVIGRETTGDSRSFGRTLTSAGVCWVPGSLVEDLSFQVTEKGMWKVEETQ